MPKIVVYQTAPVWFVKNEYFMAKIDVCRSLLPSNRVIGWDIEMTSHPNSNASFINIWDRLIWRWSPNLTRSSKLAAAPNYWGQSHIFWTCPGEPTVPIFSCDQAALWMVFSVRLSVCPSVRLSVRLSHLFDYVPIIVSSWNFQELSLGTRVRSMQKVKVRGQRSRSQRSRPNLTVSGL